MTNVVGRVAFAALLLAALAAPTGQAHGAAPAREIDTRVLLDDDGLVGYGGCFEGNCPAAPPGLDLLVLDVREAWLGDEPAVVFRIVTQTEGTGAGGLELSMAVGGATRTFAVDDAAAPGPASTFDLVQGPFDAFDGHPKAVDAWLLLSTLGAAPGDELADVAVASLAGGAPDDVMPGGWFLDGQEVPHVPHDPVEGLAAPGPGSYTLKGPAPLITLEPGAGLVDVAGGGNLTLRISNPLGGFAQEVSVGLVPGPGVLGALDRANLTVDPGATRQLTFTAAAGSLGGNVTIVARSDLGGRAVSTLQVVVPIAEPTPTPTTAAADRQDGKESPLPAGVLLALGLLALAGGRRK